jgi:hypothetical protein
MYCSVTEADGKIMPCTGSLSAEKFRSAELELLASYQGWGLKV